MENKAVKFSVKSILGDKFHQDDLWDLLCHNAFEYLLEEENCTEVSKEDYIRICRGADFFIRSDQVTTPEDCKDLGAILECFNDTDIMYESENPKAIGSFQIPDDKVLLFQFPESEDDYSIYWYNADFSVRGTLEECAQELGMSILQSFIDRKERVRKWK